MKLYMLILILFLAVVAQSALPQQASAPLTKGQVMDLVKFGMDSAELANRIKEHGIDFDPTDDDLEALRKGGAQEAVIRAIREVKPKPLTREQVGELVAGGVPSERAVTLVKQRGIDFLTDEEYVKTLRLAGGDDTLITALCEASAAAIAELVVVTSLDAEVYLDGVLQGRADAHCELAIRTRLGDHALKVSLAGWKDFDENVTLAAARGSKIEARPEYVIEVRANPKDGLKYVWIPSGTFMMGCSPGDNECAPSEMPPHHVTITKGFWMGQTPVTAGAYKRFAWSSGRRMPSAPDTNKGWANENLPMVNVSWYDAQAYCQSMGGRLPTEAEWEYAARGGSTGARYGLLNEIALYSPSVAGQTYEIARTHANAFGLYDVLGNVFQWVNDRFDDEHYHPGVWTQNADPEQDPQGPSSGQYHILRGGPWTIINAGARVSVRMRVDPTERHDDGGFRCRGESVSP
jgi:formylglycine-generating enzyme required for sulfatase activity